MKGNLKRKAALAVVIGAALAAAVLIVMQRGRRAPLAKYFPPGPLFYAEISNGREILEETARADAWRRLIGTETVRDLARAARKECARRGLPPRLLDILPSALGDRAALALYGEEGPCGAGILLVAGERGEDGGRGPWAAAGLPAGGDGKNGTRSFSLPGQPPFHGLYIRRGAWEITALAGKSPRPLLEAAMDLIEEKGGTSLARDKSFSSAWAGAGKQRGRTVAKIYFDWPSVGKRLPPVTGGWTAEGVPAAARRLARWAAGWGDGARPGRARSVLSVSRGRYLTVAAHTEFETEGGKEVRIEEPGTAPRAPRPLDLVPADAACTICYCLGERALSGEGWGPIPAEILAAAASSPDVDMERDVLPLRGDSLCIYLSGVSAEGIIPLPELCLVAGVTDADAAAGTLARAMHFFAPPAPAATPPPWDFLSPRFRGEDFRGTRIWTLAYPLPGVSPSGAVSAGCLVLGSDASLVREVVEVGKGSRRALAESTPFSEMRRLLPRSPARLVYVDGPRALEVGRKLWAWWLSVRKVMLSGDDPEGLERVERIESDLPEITAALGPFRALLAAEWESEDTVDIIYMLEIQQ